MTALLHGWDIGSAADAPWLPWGERGDARAQVLATGDGYVVAVVDVEAGYTGTPHEHANTEFLYVMAGRLRNQGQPMGPGDAYVAAIGSEHTDFEALIPSTYLSIFKL
jgi:mannose-6-phosphate isomerase-like protein (cupin superfamily)